MPFEFEDEIRIDLVRDFKVRPQLGPAPLHFRRDEIQHPPLYRMRKDDRDLRRPDLGVLPYLKELQHGRHRARSQALADGANRRATARVADLFRHLADFLLRDVRFVRHHWGRGVTEQGNRSSPPGGFA
ncbi:hypothetical protein GQ57_10150 [Burkholderia sp. MSh2]|nr:hypothetical protein GQ57_10150 [Burkholderia sp. MSh2]KFG96718.1 hypothetical protein GQ56_0113840 [Burkholderia paludis]